MPLLLRRDQPNPPPSPQEGFMLVGLIVAIFLILLALSVAAPRIAYQLRRDKEVEAAHRADQYVRAIQLYYRKFGHYPTSLDMLEKSNNIRFLRQRYTDPLTGKADWRLIHQGEAKTTVKGLFGKPLTGLAPGSLGSLAGSASPGGSGTTLGSSGSSASGSAAGGSPGAAASSGLTFGPGSNSSGSGVAGISPSSGPGSTSSGFPSSDPSAAGGGPIVGIGSAATGDAILVVNEQTTHPTWEFLYDPRIEAIRSRVNLFGGGVSSTGAGSLGSLEGPGSTTIPGSLTVPGSTGIPGSTAGAPSSSTFGSTPNQSPATSPPDTFGLTLPPAPSKPSSPPSPANPAGGPGSGSTKPAPPTTGVPVSPPQP